MWNRDMITTLLHSVLTIPMAEILSSRVNSELNVKSSYWLSKGYSVMSTLHPGNKRLNINHTGGLILKCLQLSISHFRTYWEKCLVYGMKSSIFAVITIHNLNNDIKLCLISTFFRDLNFFILRLCNKTKSERITLYGLVKNDPVHRSAEVNVNLLLQHLHIIIQSENKN